ncbi:unnamed protein product [Arctogadus glacialis]
MDIGVPLSVPQHGVHVELPQQWQVPQPVVPGGPRDRDKQNGTDPAPCSAKAHRGGAWPCLKVVPGLVLRWCLALSKGGAWPCLKVVPGLVLRWCLALSKGGAWPCLKVVPGPV